MNKIMLNVIRLANVGLNVVGGFIKKIVRYVPDGEVPDTHTQMYDAEQVAFFGSDAKFNVKKEQ